MKNLLFAYGTLRRSQRATHRRHVAPARFIANGSVSGTLYDLGEYPGATANGDARSRVYGEVLELIGSDVERRLRDLDRYEGDEYRRRRVLIRCANGEQHFAWAYFLIRKPPPTARVIESGVYRSKATARTSR